MNRTFFIFLFVGIGLLILPVLVLAYDMNCGAGQSCDADGFCQNDPDFICSCPGDEVPSCSGGGPQECLYAVVCWNGANGCSCTAPDPTPPPAEGACNSDADCSDGSSCTDDVCNNAGTPSSSCSNPDNGSCNQPPQTPTPPPPQCTTNEQCDDGILCTNNVCSGGVCNTFGGGCFCGDGACEGEENASNCFVDCGPTPSPTPTPPPSPSPSPTPPPVFQCSDLIDNDSDGLTDWPADPGCINASDNDEFNVPPNNAPSVTNVSLQEPDYCIVGPSATFAWQFVDIDGKDSQTAFQVQVDDAASFQSPVVDTGKIFSGGQSHFVGQGVLGFSTIYRGRVRVWDEADAVSAWQTMASCTGPGCQQNGTAWRTPTHRYPANVGIGIAPADPQVNEVIQFSGGGVCYDSNNNPATCLNWLWNFGDGGTAATQNPTHAYGASGVYQATLQVEDAQNYICPVPPFSKTIQVKIRLPRWREVLPR